MKAARWGKGLTCPVKYGIINSVTYGEMSERFKELVLKTSDPKRAVGSNPTLSASFSVRAPSEDEALIFDRKGTGGNSDRRLFSDRGCVLDRGL